MLATFHLLHKTMHHNPTEIFHMKNTNLHVRIHCFITIIEHGYFRRCLCPPSYYGDRCQFQNQRVSLILQFKKQTPSNWRTAFYLIIMLIDNDYIIQSYDYNIYEPIRDCDIKFHLYQSLTYYTS
jgi:hypothetical protein